MVFHTLSVITRGPIEKSSTLRPRTRLNTISQASSSENIDLTTLANTNTWLPVLSYDSITINVASGGTRR